MEYPLKSGPGSGQIRLAIVALLLSLAALCSGQYVSKNGVLSAPVDEKTSVRLFYEHDIRDHFYPPLIFRVVDSNDPRRGAAPLGPKGREVYVTVPELSNILQGMEHVNVPWKETNRVEEFGPSYEVKGLGYLDITVISSRGTARGSVGRTKVCSFLGSMDSAINTPRALWEFQRYRWFNDCEIPGYDPKRYPDR